ncbi:hypothetical protein Pmar_PMAR013675 [Perkinsus marinus ATCC 50983]|uniref:Uncharacterized protein n=1 Tax=Perkinsus marinus (strain ATCC 50983 / TXsc) TaxID=423536 RepID=C5LXZ8_PERM5|nr:hypothetical protein Pmar_PMAR013675 [Perkinsus marinus ATCC 50983]EEQ98328.1 hypothetical protein Pmar_PMAR013675 [Perkinsus marinus ATCC 50983]|eukprot:XP_002765611.1 hypothetical protein Pmar_PMAR013675 [Perkinsus marinus ATCC 50983]
MSSSRLNAWLSLDLVQKEALEEGSQVESLFGQAAERLSSGGGGSSEDFFVTLGALQADSGVTLVGRKVFPDVW